MKRYISTIVGISAIYASASASIVTLNNAFNAFDVITIRDYTLNNETEGSGYIGGDYTPMNGSRAFAFNGGSTSNDLNNVLFLNNGVTGSNVTTLTSGSVVSRVSVSTNLFVLNGNGNMNDPSINIGQTVFESELNSAVGVNTAAEFHADLLSASLDISNLAANSTATASNGGAYVYDASTAADFGGNNVAIFTATPNDFSNGLNGDRLEVSNGANDVTIIINVSGTDVTITDNFSNGFTNNEQNILINFYEATSITINSNIRGTILAPLANVIQNANIDGDIIAGSLVQNNEVHHVGFDNFIPVPEPSTFLSLAMGSVLLLYRKRKA